MFAEPTLITGDLHRVLPQTLTVYYPTMNISKFYLNSLNLKKQNKKNPTTTTTTTTTATTKTDHTAIQFSEKYRGLVRVPVSPNIAFNVFIMINLSLKKMVHESVTTFHILASSFHL